MSACTCAGTVHQSCDPEWPKNLTDDQLLHTYETIFDHEVTRVFANRLEDEMRRRELSSRRWLVDTGDD